MKKFIFAMLVALATVASFTSCSDDDDDTVYEFNGTTDNNSEGNPDTKVTLQLNSTNNTFTFNITTSANSTPVVDDYSGTFTTSGTSVILTYSDGTTTETLTADANITNEGLDKVKSIVYIIDPATSATVTLKKN